MKIQSYLIVPLIGILPQVYAEPAFAIHEVKIFSNSGPPFPPEEWAYTWDYEVRLSKFNNKDSEGAYCKSPREIPPRSRGELRLTCTRWTLPQREFVDLGDEINVRIQQPDDGRPDQSGFNVLINWR